MVRPIDTETARLDSEKLWKTLYMLESHPYGRSHQASSQLTNSKEVWISMAPLRESATGQRST